jgi:hypothetical protein
MQRFERLDHPISMHILGVWMLALAAGCSVWYRSCA